MSIAPVEGFPPPGNELSGSRQLPNSQTRAQSAVAEQASQPVSETLQKPEGIAQKHVPSTYELLRDVVEVHQDPEMKGQIIVQYLDQAHNVILQVPSNQELDVEHGIAQEFQQEAKLRATVATAHPGSEGEKTYGH
jgi:hypothetical protein